MEESIKWWTQRLKTGKKVKPPARECPPPVGVAEPSTVLNPVFSENVSQSSRCASCQRDRTAFRSTPSSPCRRRLDHSSCISSRVWKKGEIQTRQGGRAPTLTRQRRSPCALPHPTAQESGCMQRSAGTQTPRHADQPGRSTQPGRAVQPGGAAQPGRAPQPGGSLLPSLATGAPLSLELTPL